MTRSDGAIRGSDPKLPGDIRPQKPWTLEHGVLSWLLIITGLHFCSSVFPEFCDPVILMWGITVSWYEGELLINASAFNLQQFFLLRTSFLILSYPFPFLSGYAYWCLNSSTPFGLLHIWKDLKVSSKGNRLSAIQYCKVVNIYEISHFILRFQSNLCCEGKSARMKILGTRSGAAFSKCIIFLGLIFPIYNMHTCTNGIVYLTIDVWSVLAISPY